MAFGEERVSGWEGDLLVLVAVYEGILFAVVGNIFWSWVTRLGSVKRRHKDGQITSNAMQRRVKVLK